jgi:hypothetical protein
MKKAPQEKSMQGYPSSHSDDSRNIKQKVIDRLVKKGGLKACVDAHCCQCIYDDLVPGTWRKQVENCTVEVCALYHKRPMSGGAS